MGVWALGHWSFRHPGILFWCSGVRIKLFEHLCIWVFGHFGFWVFWHLGVQVFRVFGNMGVLA